jgi:hypothetical protein
MLDHWTCMLDLSDILDMYIGHVCTRFVTLCVYYGHVSMDLMCGFMLRSNLMPKCGSYAILLIYMWYSGSYADVWIKG